jgi:ubiquinone/menaquinone biosynthesis C-methylase UbiE
MDRRPALRPADAYDAVAADYDRLVDEDFWMRQLLWRRYLDLFPAGSRVLDAACGTGLDTLFLARAGRTAAGIDAAPAMIGQLRAKADRAGLEIEARVGDAADLSAWPDGAFDGIVSAFAGLNTMDLERFAAEAARVLGPGGRMLLHVLAPAGVWALARPLVRLRFRVAWEMARRRERTTEIAGSPVHLTLLPPLATYRRWFAGAFRLRRAYALGFLWPRRANALLPGLLRRALGTLEPILGRLPVVREAGRFFVLELERR